MKAYKATEKNMKCFGFQFELNKEFIHNSELVPRESGFHFCKELKHVFNYYSFSPDNRFFEVEIPDDAEIIDFDNKSVTNKIKFIRELSLNEVKKLTNGECYVDTDGGWVTNHYKHFYNEEGTCHREDGPAIIYANGTQEWWQNGKLHREDGPAIIYPNGTNFWFLHGFQCDKNYVEKSRDINKLMKLLELKFTSGNNTPVTSILLKDYEYNIIKSFLRNE